jgi:uncharacterized protein (DUF1499 family)
MATSMTSSSVSSRLIAAAPAAGLLLVVVGVIVLAVGPLGWRAGWWHYRVAFAWMMPYGGYFAIAGGVISVVALLFGWRTLGGRGVTMAVLGIVASLAIAYVPWSWNKIRGTLPPIHDITTDMQNPPEFRAVLAARAAEQGNTVVYDPKVGAQQAQAYPDIAPVDLSVPPADAFNRALDTAKRMGWTIAAAVPEAGLIEASETSRWFGFTDDVVIRVTAKDGGSRVDIRSESRQGRFDFGVNAKRVRNFTAALKSN